MTANELKKFLQIWEISQTEAARLFGIKQQVVSDIVNGKRESIPLYIQRSFYFFSLLPYRKQKALINQATHSNNAFAGDFDGAGQISGIHASAEAAPSRA